MISKIIVFFNGENFGIKLSLWYNSSKFRRGGWNMKSINLYMDESGNLGTGMGRYFLICALEVKEDVVKSLKKRAGRVINRFKIKYKIPKINEVKGWKLTEDQRMELIDSILFRGIKVRYIVLDLY